VFVKKNFSSKLKSFVSISLPLSFITKFLFFFDFFFSNLLCEINQSCCSNCLLRMLVV
jgi:hypothetical protein